MVSVGCNVAFWEGLTVDDNVSVGEPVTVLTFETEVWRRLDCTQPTIVTVINNINRTNLAKITSLFLIAVPFRLNDSTELPSERPLL